MTLTEDELNRLATSIRSAEYNLLIGAGVSLGSIGGNGKELLSGKGLTAQLSELKGVKAGASLQRVFELLNTREVRTNITSVFSNCVPGEAVRRIPRFPWRRIFTLNVDDALENAYEAPGALQDHVVRNYRDPFEDSRELAEVPIIHLHGYAKRPSDGYIFSRSAYISQIARTNSWMAVLADLMAVEPFIVIGTALDEVDIDYYFAQRSQTSSRKDMGPSIFVEPFPDALFFKDCEKYDFAPFEGKAVDLFDFLDDNVKDRRPPIELVSATAKDLFPSNTDQKAIARFLSDFELVPPLAPENSGDPRFLLGHEPSWSDLQSRLDVSRDATSSIEMSVDHALTVSTDRPQILFYSDDPGGGKTTVTRRVAFDTARRGTTTLICSPLGRLEPSFTASMLDLIDDPVLVVIDNFADQAGPTADIANAMEKNDAVFLCSERSFRDRYIRQTLAGSQFTPLRARSLTAREAQALIENYTSAGWVGSSEATKDPRKFAGTLLRDPIAVACCRILNDFSPMDRIVKSLLGSASSQDRKRYITAALAQFCITGGIRYDILVKVAGPFRMNEQISTHHPLPLAFTESRSRNYLAPLNSVIGTQALYTSARSANDDVFDIFVGLAKALAPRVNRTTIKKRSPEARLAGRLFDFDQVAEHFLGGRADEFYSEVQLDWQWNSRYWEQVALLHLSKFYKSPDSERGKEHLEAARQHARHAVSIEEHPFPLTTLGKILFVQAHSDSILRQTAFDEAFDRISAAIELERTWAWTNTQAFVTLFRGVRDISELGIRLTSKQSELLLDYTTYARRRFSRDRDLMDVIDNVQARIGK